MIALAATVLALVVIAGVRRQTAEDREARRKRRVLDRLNGVR